MRRLGTLLITLALLGTACSAGNSVFSMSVGDCFDAPDTSEVSRIATIPCDEPHDHEIYRLFDIADGDFPGAEALADEAADGCLATFDQYVGTVYQDSALDVGFLAPSVATWDDGDREVVCYLFDLSGDQLTATAKDSGL